MFDIIEPFADYSFNKSHSVGYGYLAYQTAFLKANYPVEYLAALLTSVKTNKDQTAVFLNECRQMGIAVLVPDVNESESDFSVRPGGSPAVAGALTVAISAISLWRERRRGRDPAGPDDEAGRRTSGLKTTCATAACRESGTSCALRVCG